MNIEELKKDEFWVLISKIKMYLEEPGESQWESLRHEILIELQLYEQAIMENILKTIVFDTIHNLYNKAPDINKKRPDLMLKLLTDSFDHLNKIHYEK